MPRRPHSIDRLDGLLAGVERTIVDCPDEELLAEAPHRALSVADVDAIIDRSLTSYSASSRRRRKTGASAQGSSMHMEYLRRIVATRTDLPPRLAAVFGSDRRPSQRELDDLVAALVRVGAIEPEDSGGDEQ
jgi:hypothetical protein